MPGTGLCRIANGQGVLRRATRHNQSARSVIPSKAGRVSGPGEEGSRALPLSDGSREDSEVESQVSQDSSGVKRLNKDAVRRAGTGGHDDNPGR